MDREKWMKQVIHQIHFAPDRKKIRCELEEHFEDRMEDYGDETKVIIAMGDPIELGRQLNIQHKPYLGWLWLLSWVLIVLIICMIVLVSVLNLKFSEEGVGKVDLDQLSESYYDCLEKCSEDVAYKWTINKEVQLINTKIVFEEIACDRTDKRLRMKVTSEGDAPISNVITDMTIKGDDKELAWGCLNEWAENEDGKILSVGSINTAEDFDTDTHKLEITYDRFGESFGFIVNLRTGEVTEWEK